MDSVAMMIATVIKKKMEIFRLKGLEEDQCLQLLKSHAFADVENPNDYKRLRSIAGERVKKAFRISIGSKVKMWIALGFIQQPHDQEWTMEGIGGMYFDVLVKKSFFDKFGDSGRYYTMHDLIHEMAQSISIHECLGVEDGTKLLFIIPKTLRHLSVETTNPNIFKKIGQFKYLHSLILFYGTLNQDLCNALIEIFKASRSLRLLFICASAGLGMILEEIENLIHLRYLELDSKKFTILPRSLSNLYHLQYIINHTLGGLKRPEVDDFLPSDINNLSNLRYVKLPENFISSICGIRRLKSLQELNTFDL
ncbi:hypothetical protein M5K25_005536 [Dendrobium thyrsiflorum]|uniref:Uncharacterized protein n=1 Tax=Dendrobium thyrsiflorum TaxID=117978 RepID=A0ABD0VPH9_DENTH